uniref:Chemokine vCXCL1 n=1 Tax=Strongyloides venezuelensis TaxID=75913 RepID=A0A0K0FCJ0_STRVS
MSIFKTFIIFLSFVYEIIGGSLHPRIISLGIKGRLECRLRHIRDPILIISKYRYSMRNTKYIVKRNVKCKNEFVLPRFKVCTNTRNLYLKIIHTCTSTGAPKISVKLFRWKLYNRHLRFQGYYNLGKIELSG